MTQTILFIATNVCFFGAVYLFIRYGLPTVQRLIAQQQRMYDRVLNQQLLLNIDPQQALIMAGFGIAVPAGLGYVIGGAPIMLLGALVGLFLPQLVIRHLYDKRAARLEAQLVDGITTMASGVRAGLNLVQAFELLVSNSEGPIKEEFAQLLREYQMGMDLNQAMRNAANRIGSSNYRLLFTALETHRLRGGDIGETLDRIAESIREIQRLEGKLDAITAQGRFQAWMMAVMPVFFLFMLWMIDAGGVVLLFTEPLGRILLLGVALLILMGYLWIRRILAVDI